MPPDAPPTHLLPPQSQDMSQGQLCPNSTKKVQKEVSQIANPNLPLVMLLGGLSVNLNHLKTV